MPTATRLAHGVADVGCFAATLPREGVHGLGALDMMETMRISIVGMVLIVTGFQLITVSCTLSLTRIGES